MAIIPDYNRLLYAKNTYNFFKTAVFAKNYLNYL